MKWITLACLVAYLGLACAAEAPGSNSTQDYSCDALAKVPAEQRCTFLTSSCPSESLVPYARWYYCGVAHHNVVLRFFYVALVVCLLPLAFCLLGDTAEFYIAPIMAHVSQAIPKMRPRFAGVTFVALGNGAPDLSSNIAAISAGEVVLSAGALTGAAMFVQCIVAAELVALAGPGGIKCGGAMLRDVGVYCLAIFSVLLAFTIGQVTRVFVGWALALYIIYMIWVFAGDEWHQRGRPRPSITAASFKALLAGQLPLADALAFAGGSAGAGAGQAGRAGQAGQFARHSNGEIGLEESLLPWAVAEDEEFIGPEQQFQAFDQQQQQQHGYVGVPGSRLGQPRVPSSLREASLTTEMSDFGVGGSSGAASLQGSLLSPPGGSSMTAAAAVGDPAAAARASLRASSATAATGLPHSQQQQWQEQQRRWSHPNSPPSTSQHQQQQQQLRGGTSSSAFGWASPHQQQQQQPHLLSLGGNQNYIDAKTYKQLVWADLADDQEEEQRLERQIARQLLAATRHTSSRGHSSGDEAAGSYQPPLAAAAAGPDQQQQQPLAEMQQTSPGLQQQQQQQQQQPFVDSRLLLSPFGPATDRSGQSTPVGVAAAASPSQHHQHQQQQQEAAGPLSSSEGDTWQQLQWQVTLGNSEEWRDAGPIRSWFRKVTFPLLLPAYLGQRLTIPFASGAGYSREWLIAALLCCPLAAITYLGWLSLPAIFAACGCGVAAAGAAAMLTRHDAPGQMPAQGLGGPAAAVAPGLLAVLAFCMGVAWIDTVATEVVGAVTFLAGLASLPSGVMGLTLLAWGNSLGDFFGNRAMAKAGHTSTAITACFAAPLFNMLVSLALGFSAYLHQLGAASVRVRLTPEVALGCLFLMGYNVAIICVGKLCGQRLPPWFAHFARAWYGLYFSLAVVSGFMNNR